MSQPALSTHSNEVVTYMSFMECIRTPHISYVEEYDKNELEYSIEIEKSSDMYKLKYILIECEDFNLEESNISDVISYIYFTYYDFTDQFYNVSDRMMYLSGNILNVLWKSGMIDIVKVGNNIVIKNIWSVVYKSSIHLFRAQKSCIRINIKLKNLLKSKLVIERINICHINRSQMLETSINNGILLWNQNNINVINSEAEFKIHGLINQIFIELESDFEFTDIEINFSFDYPDIKLSKAIFDVEYKIENTNIYNIKLWEDKIWDFGHSMYNDIGSNNLSKIRFINNNGENQNGNIIIYNNVFNLLTYLNEFTHIKHSIRFSTNHPIHYEYNTFQTELIESNLCYEQLETDFSCPITTNLIKKDEYYQKCKSCNNIFSHNAMKLWLNSPLSNNKCPLCRTLWSSTCIYVNTDLFTLSPDESDEEKK